MQLPDLPSLRRTNLLQLFSEFVVQRMAQSPMQQINGLDREFAAWIQVHNTYFSGMKSGARTIGNKLARQIETLCDKEKGWLDALHQVPLQPRLQPSTELQEFLQLAEQVYLAAPGARGNLTALMVDALKQQSKNF